MASYTFQWPYPAKEVFVTGTFDDWGKTIKLDQKGDIFEKQVHFPVTGEKVHFKFVVDGIWTTDKRLPEEDDGSSNVNNTLTPDDLQKESVAALKNGTTDMATISGAAPNSTTAGLAGGVPKESRAPGSTTAGLDKDVPLEQKNDVPGGFPTSPVNEFSVNPIPASGGIGNPIHLQPGEKVPDPSTFNTNTVQSTARTDPDSYDQGDSSRLNGPFSVPAVSDNMIPESSLPIGGGHNPDTTDPGVTVQSAAPTSTTAGLAAGIPLESKKQPDNINPADEVPAVVKESMSKAHQDPEAAANKVALEEKKELEHELQQRVGVENSTGEPAPTTTAATTETAPRATIPEAQSAAVSPRTQTPTGTKATEPEQDVKKDTAAPTTATTNNTKTSEGTAGSSPKEEKKKKRSSIFAKLKEKFK
ncbi:hypothetical protein BDV19DRAFT_353029 [Aspergillus venezuelensis]